MESFRKFSANTNLKLLVKNLKKTKRWQFLTHFGQKIPNIEFSHRYHYLHTLVDTLEKTLGSFQPKLMTKVEVISLKLSEN